MKTQDILVCRLEIYRKLIHLTSIWIPILYYITTKNYILIILTIVTLFTIIIELYRDHIHIINNVYNKIFAPILRNHEIPGRFSGASYLLISSLISIIFFSKTIAITSISMLVISDTSAAIVGIKYGKKIINTNNNKTFEGFIAFIISGIITVFIIGMFCSLTKKYFLIASLSVLLSAFTELFITKINDNFFIPLFSSAIMAMFL